MATKEGIGNFYDKLSPEELCEWLAARLKANGLELKEEPRRKFLDNEINGLAFRKLSEATLLQMGFKWGTAQNILDIMSSLSAENAPAVGCTMNFSPKIMQYMSESGPSNGAAPACMPYKGHLWRKESLVVKLCNGEHLAEWGLTPEKFLECANRWSAGVVEGGNFIPKFEFNDSLPPDIIAELNKDEKIESDVGYHASRQAAKSYLDLSHNDPKYREHLIGHEFGHVLGLGHEHQRSKLWKLIGDFIDKEKMKLALQTKYDSWKEDEHAEDGGSTEDYDPDSIMHYWFRCEWLKDGYSDEATIKTHPALNEEAKKALLGIIKRHGPMSRYPSRRDLKFLSDQYKNARGVLDMPQVPHKRDIRLAGGGSEPSPKRIKADSASGMNDKPSMDQLLNFKDGTSKINIPQRIGIKYSNFGTQLLQGDFGHIQSLEQQYSRDSEKINTVILQEWLGGKGKEPKSWATLVEVLIDIELGELARQIKESIMQSSNED